MNETLPKLRKYDVPVIVNIAASSPEEYGELAHKLDVDGVNAVEINISCPNVKQGGIAFGTCPDSAAAVVEQVKKHFTKTVITKLSPNVTSITEMALAVENAGTDAISLINTLIGMKIDIERQRPVLGNITGGLSGPAVRPVAVRMCYEVALSVWAVSKQPKTPWNFSSAVQVPLQLVRLISAIPALPKPSATAFWTI